MVSFCLFLAGSSIAQITSITKPQVSPKSTITQRVGVTDITIVYHSPQVKERDVWGSMVPYGQVWRAGANDNTTISFTHDVNINGKPIKAGIYGLHMIPEKTEWTIAFSKDYKSWGSYSYKEANDALRIKVNPKTTAHTEWLTYHFPEKGKDKCQVALSWEKLTVAFDVSIPNADKVILANMEREIKLLPEDKRWGGYAEMVAFGTQTGQFKDKWLQWADASIALDKNFTSMRFKAMALRKLDKNEEADAVMKEALTVATEQEVNSYGYQMVAAKQLDKAVDVFEMNCKNHPKSWNTYDSLAEAYGMKGDKKKAKKYYKKARGMAPEEQYARIDAAVSAL